MKLAGTRFASAMTGTQPTGWLLTGARQTPPRFQPYSVPAICWSRLTDLTFSRIDRAVAIEILSHGEESPTEQGDKA